MAKRRVLGTSHRLLVSIARYRMSAEKVKNAMFLVTRLDNQHLDVRVQGALDSTQLLRLIQALFDTTSGMTQTKVLFRLEHFEMPTPIVVLGELTRQPQLVAFVDRISRCAFVAEKPWQRLITRLQGILLPDLDVKSFALQDLAQAKQWLNEARVPIQGVWLSSNTNVVRSIR